jgi:DNA-binding response OmpR family regulator
LTNILIVDDEPDFREMLDLLMKKEGFHTKLAVNGFDFLNIIEFFKPDIVTLDVNMPGLTTVEILEKLNKKQINIKIILLTVVRYSKEDKKKIMNIGNVVEVVTKPFDIDELIEKIYSYTNH